MVQATTEGDFHPCLFCDATSVEMSDEDVVPRWLLHYLKLSSHDKMFHGVGNVETGAIEYTTTSSYRFKEPRICRAACNNGWMSRLEKRAQVILIPLMDGRRSFTDLSLEERPIVAKWSAKTAYMHVCARDLDVVPIEHLHSLNGDEGRPSPGVVVLAMQTDHWKPSSYFQSNNWPIVGVSPPAKAPSDAYRVAVQFGRLYLLTAFWPGNDHRFLVTRGDSFITPPSEWFVYDGWIPKEGTLDPIVRFTTELGVIDRRAAAALTT